jgi:tetratricopeptide (TPR) repeat protein
MGVLEDAQGGLGVDMWRGTRRAHVERLLARLPAAPSSLVLRDLQRRLLLSVAGAPEGDGAAGSAAEGQLVALRVDRLAAMGEERGLTALLDAVPTRLANEPIARARVDAAWLAGDMAGACANVQRAASGHGGAYWQKAEVFCQAAAGERAPAETGLRLLQEQRLIDDPAFGLLIEAINGNSRVRVDKVARLDAMLLAMLGVAKRAVPGDAARAAAPGVQAALAHGAAGDTSFKLAIAERAFAAGALARETLAEIYKTANLPTDAIANTLQRAEAGDPALSQALIHRALAIQTSSAERIRLIEKAAQIARKRGGYLAAARALAPAVGELRPGPELAGFAHEAARIFYAAGQINGAHAWYELARAQDGRTPEAAQATLALWPLARLAEGDIAGPWEDGRLTAWFDAELKRDGKKAVERATTLYSLLDAVGEPVTGEAWRELLHGVERASAAMPSPALWRVFGDAAESRRVGETVLLAALSLGDLPLDQASPMLLHGLITNLRLVGLDAEARALALEAALAAGL